jgi:cob(I)alamin adenosyltransferase
VERLVKIYTRTGDAGQTSLLGGKRVKKDHPRVETYGTVDEANSALGLAGSLCSLPFLQDIAREIQERLLVVGADLARAEGSTVPVTPVGEEDVTRLEELIDQLEVKKPKQKGFVLPGGTAAAGAFDLARTIVRRAERLCTALAREEAVNPFVLKYLNRLSDLLFVMARVDEHEAFIKQVTREVIKKMSGILENKTLALAKELAQAAEEAAQSLGVPMVMAVVDQGGNLVLVHRMDEALLASIDIAVNKAYTAVAVKLPTHQLAGLSLPGQPLYGIEATNRGRIVIFGGGYPIYQNGELIGGLGVSGGTVKQDMQVAEAALAKALGLLEGGIK